MAQVQRVPRGGNAVLLRGSGSSQRAGPHRVGKQPDGDFNKRQGESQTRLNAQGVFGSSHIMYYAFGTIQGREAAVSHQRRQVASHLRDLDHSGRCVGSFPRRRQEGEWRESGSLSPHQTPGSADPRPGAGKHSMLLKWSLL